MSYQSTKVIELGSCAFRQWKATHSHCSKIHGYQLIAKFYFGASTLDDKNWVVDFASLKPLKALLNNQFDHTLCVAKDDPLIEIFQHLHNMGGCDIRIMDAVGIEKTAEFCFKSAQTFLKEAYGDRCWVEKVEVFEHELNSAIYSEQRPVVYSTSFNTPAAVTSTPPLEAAAEIKVDETTVNVETVAETELPTPTPLQVPPAGPTGSTTKGPGPVPLRSGVTNGYSGLFDGISWGSR